MKPDPKAEAAVRVGRQQAFAVLASKCSAAQAQCLREMRETRAHELFGLSWEEFCKRYLGISRAHADSIIRRHEEFGNAYFRFAEICRVSPETFRKIADKVTEETIEIDGELVPLTPLNAARIRKSIQHLLKLNF